MVLRFEITGAFYAKPWMNEWMNEWLNIRLLEVICKFVMLIKTDSEVEGQKVQQLEREIIIWYYLEIGETIMK